MWSSQKSHTMRWCWTLQVDGVFWTAFCYLWSLVIDMSCYVVQPSVWPLSDRAGKWTVCPHSLPPALSDVVRGAEALVSKCGRSQWLLWCLASLFSFTGILFFFSINEKPLNFNLFSAEANIWQAFKLPWPSRDVQCAWAMTVDNKITQKEKLHFLAFHQIYSSVALWWPCEISK